MPNGYLQLVLHAHLPYIRHPEYERFLEERWFFEAVTETYIPLVKFFDRLRDEGKPFKLTLSVSPTLANMMEDPLLRQRCVRHLDMLIRLAEAECERTRHWRDVHFLAQMYRQLFEEARHTFVERCGTRLVSAFREHAEAGRLELITCAGTHGFLPLLNSEPATVRAQVFTAVHEHERIFGSKPKGMWVPECAYYPGLDAVLAEAGIRYFMADSHAVDHADPRPLFGVSAPVYTPSGVAAFGRHPLTSKLVWSTSVGYPADFNYREYYRDIGYDLDQDYLEPFQYAKGIRTHTGIKYHRITGKTRQQTSVQSGLGARDGGEARPRLRGPLPRPGQPRPRRDAVPVRDRVALRRRAVRPLVVRGAAVDLLRPARAVRRRRPGTGHAGRIPVGLPDPAKGHAGREQLGQERLPRALGQPQDRLDVAAVARGGGPDASDGADGIPTKPHGGLEDRLLRQAGRELMLAQSSDWPFIITNGTTEQYARRRFHDHVHRFHDLLGDLDRDEIDAGKLEALEHMDALFPELDYRLFASGA